MLALVKILRERPTLNRYIIGRRLYQRRDVELSFIARRQFTVDSSETNVYRHGASPTTTPRRRWRSSAARSARRSPARRSPTTRCSTSSCTCRAPCSRWRSTAGLWDFYVDTPSFLRGIDPLRCSAYVANLGSVGLGAAYHHLFEWGTCSLFVTIGQGEADRRRRRGRPADRTADAWS